MIYKLTLTNPHLGDWLMGFGNLPDSPIMLSTCERLANRVTGKVPLPHVDLPAEVASPSPSPTPPPPSPTPTPDSPAPDSPAPDSPAPDSPAPEVIDLSSDDYPDDNQGADMGDDPGTVSATC